MKIVLEELEFRDDVQVLVLTGEGAAWSAGMDLLEYFREGGPGWQDRINDALRAVVEADGGE